MLTWDLHKLTMIFLRKRGFFMNKILNDFIEKLRTNQKLQCEFKKCKTLKQSYDRFMEGKCSYEEYESFFEDLIKRKAQLSDQDLEQVCGGISLKKCLLQ